MQKFAFVLASAWLLIAAPAAAGVALGDNQQTLTHDCATDGTVAINGNENTITLTGTCQAVAINGNDNKVTIGSVPALSINGNDNNVTVTAVDNVALIGNDNALTYKKPLKKKKVKVSKLGSGNKVARQK